MEVALAWFQKQGAGVCYPILEGATTFLSLLESKWIGASRKFLAEETGMHFHLSVQSANTTDYRFCSMEAIRISDLCLLEGKQMDTPSKLKGFFSFDQRPHRRPNKSSPRMAVRKNQMATLEKNEQNISLRSQRYSV